MAKKVVQAVDLRFLKAGTVNRSVRNSAHLAARDYCIAHDVDDQHELYALTHWASEWADRSVRQLAKGRPVPEPNLTYEAPGLVGLKRIPSELCMSVQTAIHAEFTRQMRLVLQQLHIINTHLLTTGHDLFDDLLDDKQ